jgi:hypothetical protein
VLIIHWVATLTSLALVWVGDVLLSRSLCAVIVVGGRRRWWAVVAGDAGVLGGW